MQVNTRSINSTTGTCFFCFFCFCSLFCWDEAHIDMILTTSKFCFLLCWDEAQIYMIVNTSKFCFLLCWDEAQIYMILTTSKFILFRVGWDEGSDVLFAQGSDLLFYYQVPDVILSLNPSSLPVCCCLCRWLGSAWPRSQTSSLLSTSTVATTLCCACRVPTTTRRESGSSWAS